MSKVNLTEDVQQLRASFEAILVTAAKKLHYSNPGGVWEHGPSPPVSHDGSELITLLVGHPKMLRTHAVGILGDFCQNKSFHVSLSYYTY